MTGYDKRYLRIAMPAALESLFMILLASADLIMVGTLGAVSIAAISIFLQPRLVILCFSRSLSAAVMLLVSREAGRDDRREAADILKKSLFAGTAVFICIHALFYLYLEDIFYLMGAKEEYIAPALVYGNIALFSVFITSLTLIFQAVQLGYGQTAVIMKTNVAGNIVNVVMNALLIFGLGPFPAMGVAGAAVGTVISTVFTLVWTLRIMQKERLLSGGSFLPDRRYFRRIAPVFLSVFSEQGFERTGMVLFTRMAAGLGTVPFAVHSICMNISDIYWDYTIGMGKASMVMAGQSVGKASEKDWRTYNRTGIKWSLIFSSVACLVTLIFKEEIFSFYSSDPAALAMSGSVMILVALVSFPEAQAIVCAGILRGSGRTAAVAAYSFISVTLLRPAMTAFFLYGLGLGLMGCWWALLLDQCIRASCATFLVRRLKRMSWQELLAGA